MGWDGKSPDKQLIGCSCMGWRMPCGELCFLKNYQSTNDWQCCYIRGRCSYVFHTKQGRKTHTFWGISWYQRMFGAISEMLYKPKSSKPSSAVHDALSEKSYLIQQLQHILLLAVLCWRLPACIIHCYQLPLRAVPLRDGLWYAQASIAVLTLCLNLVSLCCTGMTPYTGHPIFSCCRPMLASALLQAANSCHQS
jgi:hypothetical protein